jgi:hypothetical protein
MIGLKNIFKNLEGASLGYRLRHIRYELKYAWQRAWRGYDDSMVFDMNDTFIELYREILKDFKENLHGYPGTMTEEEWNDILDEMIGSLDRMYYVLFKSDNDDADLVEQEKDRFFELFKEHFWSLWD